MTYDNFINLIDNYVTGDKQLFLQEKGFNPSVLVDTTDYEKVLSLVIASADGDVKTLVSLSGITAAAFSRRFRIPYRTLQDWMSGRNTPPPYIPVMIGHILASDLYLDPIKIADDVETECLTRGIPSPTKMSSRRKRYMSAITNNGLKILLSPGLSKYILYTLINVRPNGVKQVWYLDGEGLLTDRALFCWDDDFPKIGEVITIYSNI